MSLVIGGGAIAPLADGTAVLTRQQGGAAAAVGAGTDLIATVLTALLIPAFGVSWRDLLNVAAVQSDSGYTEADLFELRAQVDVLAVPAASSTIDYGAISALIAQAVASALVLRVTPDSTAGDGAPRPVPLFVPGASIVPVRFGVTTPNAVVSVSSLATAQTILLPEIVNVGCALTIFAGLVSRD